MKTIVLRGTTDASGDVTVGGTQVSGVEYTLGILHAVQLIDGTFDDGVDITLTCEQQNLSIPLLVMADFNTDQMIYPRVLQNLNADGSALTTHTLPVLNGYPKMVIAQGGNTKEGGCILYVLD